MPLHIPDLNCGNFTEMTLTKQLETIDAILRTHKNRKFLLIGSSLGGYVATLYVNLEKYRNHHARIRKLILLAPAFQFQKILSKDKMKLQQWKKEKAIMVEHYGYKKTLPLHYDFYTDARSYANFPLTKEIPALVFHGIRDETVPYRVSIDYLQLNRKAELVLLNSDHSLTDALETIWRYMQLYIDSRQ